MIKILLNETSLVAKDHRGTTIAKIPMSIQDSSVIHVERYRKSYRVTLNDVTFWNVASCMWVGDSDKVPKVIHDDEEEKVWKDIMDGFEIALKVL